MLFYISKYILLVLVIFSCYTYLLPTIKVSFKFVKFFWYLLIISFTIFVYFAVPEESEDLYRYYIVLDYFRKGQASIDIYNYNIPLIAQFIFSFSSIFDSNGILPSLSTILWSYFAGSILLDLYKNNKIKLQSFLICLIFLLGNGSVFYIISAIRYTLAYAIWAYGYYFFLYKNNKNKLFWLFTIIALLIHKSVLLLIPITIIYNLIIKKCSSFKIWIRISLSIFIFFIIFNTSLPAMFFNLIFLDIVGNNFLAYQNYTLTIGKENIIRFFILLILVCLELLSCKKNNCYKISLPFFILMISFVSISMPIFYERLIGLLAIIELPTLVNFYNYKLSNTKQRIIYVCLLLPILWLSLFYSVYHLFSHFTFNGEFYQDTMRILLFKF